MSSTFLMPNPKNHLSPGPPNTWYNGHDLIDKQITDFRWGKPSFWPGSATGFQIKAFANPVNSDLLKMEIIPILL